MLVWARKSSILSVYRLAHYELKFCYQTVASLIFIWYLEPSFKNCILIHSYSISSHEFTWHLSMNWTVSCLYLFCLYRQGFCLCNVLSLTDLLDCDDFRTDGFYVHQYQFMDKVRKLETSLVTL